MSSIFDDLEFNEDHEALVSIDPESSIMITRGAFGIGSMFRELCTDDECEGIECKTESKLEIITLILQDIEGNDLTLVVPKISQFGQTLCDPETYETFRQDSGI